MSIFVAARGRVVGRPSTITSDQGDLVSFLIGSVRVGIQGSSEKTIDGLPVIEVTCRSGSFGDRVLNGLSNDTSVVVVGALRVSLPFEHYDDRDLVLVSIDADTVGVDLARDEFDATETTRHAGCPWRRLHRISETLRHGLRRRRHARAVSARATS